MRPRLKDSEVNHLRLLLGWVRCEIGQSPEENIETMRKIAPHCPDISDEGKARLIEHHQKVTSVPKYVRAAIKALSKTIEVQRGATVDSTASPPQKRIAP